MIYSSNVSPWAVGQRKDYSYVYIEKDKYRLSPLDCPVRTLALSLTPIGPTILVEWEE